MCEGKDKAADSTSSTHTSSDQIPIYSNATDRTQIMDDDEDLNMKSLSLSDESITRKERTGNESDIENRDNNALPKATTKELTVEIRYKPKSKKTRGPRKTNPKSKKAEGWGRGDLE